MLDIPNHGSGLHPHSRCMIHFWYPLLVSRGAADRSEPNGVRQPTFRRFQCRAVYFPRSANCSPFSKRQGFVQRVRKAQSTNFYGPFVDQPRTRRQLPAPLAVSNRYGIVAVQSFPLRELKGPVSQTATDICVIPCYIQTQIDNIYIYIYIYISIYQ